MNYLYCPECGNYLGSLGANECYSCSWHQESKESEECEPDDRNFEFSYNSYTSNVQ